MSDTSVGGTTIPNVTDDTVSEGLFPAGRLNNGVGNQDYSFSVQDPQQYYSNFYDSSWTTFVTEVHPRVYTGATLKCHVGFQSNGGDAVGGDKGPWQ